MLDTVAVMTMPRLAWSDNMECVVKNCMMHGIRFIRSTGAFWGQGMSRALEQAMRENNCEFIYTIDYDTVFTSQEIVRLRQILEMNPELDVLCCQQIHREKDTVLMTPTADNGIPRAELDYEETLCDWMPIRNGNFGLTIIRRSALDRLPHPWFVGKPNEEGRWGDGRVDDDIHFWHHAARSGLKIGVAPQVRVGHIQCMVTWPDLQFGAVHQYISEYQRNGRPSQCQTF